MPEEVRSRRNPNIHPRVLEEHQERITPGIALSAQLLACLFPVLASPRKMASV
jgi:hypothetical protein